MRKLVIATIGAALVTAFPAWTQSIPASSASAGGQAVVAITRGVSVTDVTNMISNQAADKQGTHCGASRLSDPGNMSSSCMGHNPAYSCPAGYFQSAIGWRADGVYICFKS